MMAHVLPLRQPCHALKFARVIMNLVLIPRHWNLIILFVIDQLDTLTTTSKSFCTISEPTTPIPNIFLVADTRIGILPSWIGTIGNVTDLASFAFTLNVMGFVLSPGLSVEQNSRLPERLTSN